LEGRWDEAAGWIRRCRLSGLTDAPFWRAWLEWAQGTDQPDEVVSALKHLGPKDLGLGERLAARAWLARRRGDDRGEGEALELWLRAEPTEPRPPGRPPELAQRARQPPRTAQLRRGKGRGRQ